MKLIPKYISLAFLLGFVAILASAQSDTLIVSSETTLQKEADMDRLYKLFVEDKHKEVNHLWKVNLVDIGFLDPNIGYEQRITKFMTSETYLSMHYENGSFSRKAYGINFNENIRFYHNIKHRVKKDRRTSGFSGNYFSVGGFAKYYNRSQEPLSSSWIGYTKKELSTYGIELKYGLHRRIGNIGYLDIFGGIQYYESKRMEIGIPADLNTLLYVQEYKFIIGIRAGFAIDSYKSLKRMLK